MISPGFQSQSYKSYRKMVLKGEKAKQDFKYSHLGAGVGMSEQMITQMDVRYHRVNPGPSIPTISKITFRTNINP